MGPSGKIGRSDGEFSVAQFFDIGGHEYVRRWVSFQEAMEAYQHYTRSVAARNGMVIKVIVTDGGDYTNVMWKFGEGMVYPTKEMLEAAR